MTCHSVRRPLHLAIVSLLALVSLVFLSGCFPPDPPEIRDHILGVISALDPNDAFSIDQVAGLRTLGSQAVPVLLEILLDGDGEAADRRHGRVARWAASYALNGLVSDPLITPSTLARGLTDPDSTIAVLTAATILGTASEGEASPEAVSAAFEVLLSASEQPTVMFLSEPPEALAGFAARVLSEAIAAGLSSYVQELSVLPPPSVAADDRPEASSEVRPLRSRATDHTCRINVIVPIEFRGPGATSQRIARWVEEIESFWNGINGYRTYRNASVEFMVASIIRSGSSERGGYHQVYVEKTPWWGYTRSSVEFLQDCCHDPPDTRRTALIDAFRCSAVESDTQAWSSRASTLVLAHEFGHLLGLGEEYIGDNTNINPQPIDPQSIMAQVWGSVDVLPEHVSLVIGRAIAGGWDLPCTELVFLESEHELYAIAPTSGGQDRRVGAIETSGGDKPSITDLAWDGRNGVLWGVSFDQLYRIDAFTGHAEPVGVGLGVDLVNALAVDSEGTLYGSNQGGNLFRVDEESGQATAVGSFGNGYSSSGDLAFCLDGKLYAACNASGTHDILLSVDPLTGTATPVGNIGFSDVYGLFTVDNGLYGATFWSELISIDTSTGRGSFIRELTFPSWGAERASGAESNRGNKLRGIPLP